MNNTWIFRPAVAADIPAMLAIYEPYVLHTSVTFEYTLPTEEEFAARMAQGAGKFPWLVCEKNGKVAFEPDYGSEVYLKYLERLMRAYGEHFNGKKEIEYVSI